MVHVTRFSHAHNGVEQKDAIDLLNGSLGQFLVNPVQWVARLECNHVGMPHVSKPSPDLGR